MHDFCDEWFCAAVDCDLRACRQYLPAGGVWRIGKFDDASAPTPPPPQASNSPFWAQWGSTAQHSGAVNVAAQGLNKKLADIVYDPFVVQEQAEFGGDLVAHYQATLTDGNDFYMESKSGTYPSCNPAGDWQNGTACGPNAWDQLTWNVTRYTWERCYPDLDLEVRFRLEARTQCDRRAWRMGTGVSFRAGEWLPVRAGCGRNCI